MTFSSATGGHVYLGVVIVPVGRWTGNWRNIIPNVTQSDCGGATLYFPTNQDNAWSFRVARDDVNYPEILGLAQGTIIAALAFGLGDSGLCDLLENTTVESLDKENDVETGEVVRITISGRGGFLTANEPVP